MSKGSLVVNFTAIEDAITNGQRVTTKDLASAYLCNPVTMRDALVKHFGDRIKFKRGRTGGITLDGVGAAVPADAAEAAA
jgi:hypothetical protein